MSAGTSSGSAGSREKPITRSSSARKESAVQPCSRKRNLKRAFSRLWRSTSLARKTSAMPGATATTWSRRTNAVRRVRGKAAANAQRKSDLLPTVACARCCREADVVDFRIGAPVAAAGDGHFELTRQVVELGVATECLVDRKCK